MLPSVVFRVPLPPQKKLIVFLACVSVCVSPWQSTTWLELLLAAIGEGFADHVAEGKLLHGNHDNTCIRELLFLFFR